MKKWLFLLLLAMCTSIFAFAQNRQIKGKVTDDAGAPLSGVSVMIKGTKRGTTTNAQGNFTISAPSGDVTLELSSASYKTMSLVVSDGNSQDVAAKLEKDAAQLDDVVVIGYQTVRRKDVLASVASVGAKDLKDIPINSAAEALNGRLAGVTASTAEGSPDAIVRIRVRGGMSITGDNSPLFIVDGVQVENALNFISPQDIQSVDVLKDAAATAIYGARGANGVMIITTKSGRPGRMVVSYNGFVGVRTLAKTLDVLDPYDYVFYQSERSRGSSTDSTSFTNNFGHTWDTLENYRNVGVVDWQDEAFGNTGINTSHNISMGGGKKLTYMFGYTYNNDEAVVLRSSYKRHILNLKLDYQVTEKLKAGISTRYNHQDVYGAGVSDDRGSSFNRLRNAVKYRPFLSTEQDIDDNDPIADPNVGNGLSLVNPILLAEAEYRKKTTNALNFSVYGNYKITKNLSFRSTFGYEHNRFIDRQFSDSLTPYSKTQGGANPIINLDTITKKTITNSNVLTYSVKNYRNKHDFDVILGQEIYELRTESRASRVRDYPNFITPDAAFENTDQGVNVAGYPRLGKIRFTSASFFGRINYSFLNKYLFSFNIRADGASKFIPGKQWGYFPAGSFAWRVKSEKFMQDVGFINDLKFRIGFGTVGNNRIDDYLFLTTFKNDGTYYYGIGNQAITAYYPSALVNETLKWESMVNRNIGIDISLFRNRVDLSVDIYKNNSKDLLLVVPIASTYGYSEQYQNVGETSNKGVEIQLNSTIMRKTNFTWNANFNISFNKNKIVKLGQNQQQFFPAAAWGVSGQPADYIQKIGKPVGSMWGYVTDGFYTVNDFDYNNGVYTLKPGIVSNASVIGVVMPGSIKFVDVDGDGTVENSDEDRTIIGDPTPKFTGGLAQQFKYKRWDLSVFVNFSVGNDIYNANKIELTNGYTNNANMLAIMADRFRVVTPTGQTAIWVNSSNQVVGIPPDQLAAMNANATIWQPLKGAGAFYPHSWAIEDGSFLRLNNITIGYELPVKKLAGLKMTRFRLYATANNLAIITNYSGYDPEVSVRRNPLTPGLDYSAYPKSRTFIFGVNATF